MGEKVANALKTHCKNGHPLSGTNLYRRPDGRRECRRCGNRVNPRNLSEPLLPRLADFQWPDNYTRDDVLRFFALFTNRNERGCWIWQRSVHGATNGIGYGALYVNGVRHKAHRFSYENLVGPIPDGLLVCHHCDTKPCVNPDHLYLGTHQQNNLDAVRRGLHANGLRSPLRNRNTSAATKAARTARLERRAVAAREKGKG